jgi:hypothetical protein
MSWGIRRQNEVNGLSRDNIFLTRGANFAYHVLLEPARAPSAAERIGALFPFSKNRARRVRFVSVFDMGLGGEWLGGFI